MTDANNASEPFLPACPHCKQRAGAQPSFCLPMGHLVLITMFCANPKCATILHLQYVDLDSLPDAVIEELQEKERRFIEALQSRIVHPGAEDIDAMNPNLRQAMDALARTKHKQ